MELGLQDKGKDEFKGKHGCTEDNQNVIIARVQFHGISNSSLQDIGPNGTNTKRYNSPLGLENPLPNNEDLFIWGYSFICDHNDVNQDNYSQDKGCKQKCDNNSE